MRNSLFKYNYLQELPDDIKILIYKRVYKSNYLLVLKELLANINNKKYYNNLKQFIINQEEPKLNLLIYLLQNINIQREQKRNINDSMISCFKKHLTSNNIAKANINKIKIASNIFKYLDKIIAKTLINLIKSSNHIDIDDTGEYFVLNINTTVCCFAQLYLMVMMFWQFIQKELYEFYELHKEAYNMYINQLFINDYDIGLYYWGGNNFRNDILMNNLQKIKNDNASLYRKITRQLRNISKTESLYINFETCNIIDNYIIKDNSIIIQFKKL
jgi:hypothetical protein